MSNFIKEAKEFTIDTTRVLSMWDFWLSGEHCHNLGIISAIVLDIAKSAMSVAAPVFLSLAVDKIATKDDENQQKLAANYLFVWASLLGAEQFLRALNTVIVSKIQTTLGNQLIGEQALNKIHRLQISALEAHISSTATPYELIRVADDTNVLLSRSIHELIPLFLTLVFAASIINNETFKAPHLSDSTIALLWGYTVFNFVVCLSYAYLQKNVNKTLYEKQGHFTETLAEDITTMPTLRMLGHADLYRETTKELFLDYTNYVVSTGVAPALFRTFIIKGGLLAVCLGAMQMIGHGEFKASNFDELVFFINYLLMFHDLTESFGLNVLDTRRAITGLKKLQTIIADDNNTYPDETISNNLNTLITPPQSQRATVTPVIEFQNVSLRINNKLILNQVTFQILPGESCAFVGKTGSGKSSIIKLICGIYQPTSGNIFINGHNIRNAAHNHLRELITLTSQDVQLFYSNIAPSTSKLQYNVLMGHIDSPKLKKVKQDTQNATEKATHDTLFFTKSQACLLGTIPTTLDQLSGGEVQRIGLARGLRNTTPIMIIDEPTSALDALSEQTIIDNFNAFLSQKGQQQVLLLTGHRLKTVQSATKIVVMENGEVKETGTHNELIAHQQRYQRYYTTQENTHSFTFIQPSQPPAVPVPGAGVLPRPYGIK